MGLSRAPLAGFVPFDGPDGDSVVEPRPQASQHVWRSVGADGDFLTWALWGAVSQHVAINFCLGVIPGHPEAALRFISNQDVSGSVQFYVEEYVSTDHQRKDTTKSI